MSDMRVEYSKDLGKRCLIGKLPSNKRISKRSINRYKGKDTVRKIDKVPNEWF